MNSWVMFFLGAWIGATLSPILLGVAMLRAQKIQGGTE